MNTRELLEQDDVWRTSDCILIPLVEMDPGHRRATLAFLRRRAGYLAKVSLILEERIFLNAPDDVYDQWAAEKRRELDDSPQEWLERRPLVRELARLVDLDSRGSVVDGEVVMGELAVGGQVSS